MNILFHLLHLFIIFNLKYRVYEGWVKVQINSLLNLDTYRNDRKIEKKLEERNS